MFLFYHSKQTEENKNFYKGLLFETLLKRYLESSGFRVELRKKKNSLEYDIEGVNATTGQLVIGEAKALDKPISGKEFSAFVGKLVPLGLYERQLHGLFLSVSPLTPDADDYHSKVKSYGITSITGKELFKSITETLKCPSFDSMANILKQQGYIPVSSNILTTDDDIFLTLIARAHNSVTPAYFSVFDFYCNQIYDLKFLKALASAEASLQPLDPISQKISSVPQKSEREIPKGLSLGTDWSDYRLPASPVVFIGRQDFIKRLFNYIDENEGANILQVKSRSGVGKSSILAYIDKIKSEAGAITELHDARDIKSTLDIYSVMQRFTKSDYLAQDFRDIESQLSDFAADNGDVLKLFMVDQFESTFLVPEIFEGYENLIDIFTRNKNKVFFILARKNDQLTTYDNSKISLSKINESSKSFELPDFSPEEAINLISKINEASTKMISRNVRAYVLGFAQGFPWLLKRTMAHLMKLISRGVAQSELLSAGLRLDDLFNEELEELDEIERDYLFRIVRLLPADLNQIHRQFDEDPLLLRILDKLTNSRLIRLTGLTYDTYNDVFKDYLVYQKLPEFHQISVYRTSPSAVLAVFHSLIDSKSFSVEDIEKSQGHSRGYAFNILRELRNLNLITAGREGWEIPQSVRDIYNRGHLGEYIRRQLLNNDIVGRLIEAVSRGDDFFSVKEMSKYLQKHFPFIEASTKTWKTYGQVYRAWLLETKLLIEAERGNLIQPTESRSVIIESLGNLGILRLGGRKQFRQQLDFFLPSSLNINRVENALQAIQRGVPVSALEDREAISDLRLGGWLTGDQPVQVSPDEFRLLLKEALMAQPLQQIWNTVNEGEPVRPPFEKMMDGRYTEETLKWRLKTLLRWGKDLEIIPKERVRHQHKARKTDMPFQKSKKESIKKVKFRPKLIIEECPLSSTELENNISYIHIGSFVKNAFPRIKGITRIDVKGTNTHGWEIRIMRRGKKHNEYFGDFIYGGIKDAFEAAKEQLAELNKIYKPYNRIENASRLSIRNKSGIIGIRRGKKVTKRNGKIWTNDVWIAHGSPRPGVKTNKSFSIKRWGEEGAKEKARAQRKEWEKEMELYEQAFITKGGMP